MMTSGSFFAQVLHLVSSGLLVSFHVQSVPASAKL